MRLLDIIVAQELVYWKDLRESGVVFTVGLITLLSMTCCSIISVFAWISLLTLSGTISFRIYRLILGPVQKKDGVPFKYGRLSHLKFIYSF